MKKFQRIVAVTCVVAAWPFLAQASTLTIDDQAGGTMVFTSDLALQANVTMSDYAALTGYAVPPLTAGFFSTYAYLKDTDGSISDVLELNVALPGEVLLLGGAVAQFVSFQMWSQGASGFDAAKLAAATWAGGQGLVPFLAETGAWQDVTLLMGAGGLALDLQVRSFEDAVDPGPGGGDGGGATVPEPASLMLCGSGIAALIARRRARRRAA